MPGHNFLVPAGGVVDGCGAMGQLERAGSADFWTVTTDDITQSWTLRVTNGIPYRISWGDGAVSDVVGNGADQATAHNYAGAGTYRISLRIDRTHLLRIDANNASLTGPMLPIHRCPDLYQAYLYTNSLSGSLCSFPPALSLLNVRANSLNGTLPSSLPAPSYNINVSANVGLIGSLPSVTGCNALVTFHFGDCGFTGTIPALTDCVGLVTFLCMNNALTSYAASTIAATCTMFRADGNALDLAAVDQILTDFTTGAGGRPGAGTVNLSGGTNAVPTPGVKNAFIAALPGWALATN